MQENKILSQEEIASLIEGFEKKAQELSTKLRTTVRFETFTYTNDDKQVTDVKVAYVRQPHNMVAVKAMDALVHERYYEAGNILFPSCFMEDESDKLSDNEKLGLIGQIGFLLDIKVPDLKKN
jgi:hypothetical protein